MAFQVYGIISPPGGGAPNWSAAQLLFDSRPGIVSDSDQILEPLLTRSVNSVATLEFFLPITSVFNSWMNVRATWVQVIETGIPEPKFVGRVSMVDDSTSEGSSFVCESDLSVLNDTVCPNFNLEGVAESPTTIITRFVNMHNAQVDSSRKLIVGLVDNDLDPNGLIVRSSNTFPLPNMWEIVSDRTFGSSTGGYLYTSGQAGSRTLNWVKTMLPESKQLLTADMSLAGFNKSVDGTGVVTACEPYGAKLSDDPDDPSRVAVTSSTPGAVLLYTSPSDGQPHYGAVDTTAEANYGRVIISSQFDGISSDVALLAAAGKVVSDRKSVTLTITADAIDQHLVDPTAASIEPGQLVPIMVPSLVAPGSKLLCSSRIERLDTPQDLQIVLGATQASSVDILLESTKLGSQVETVVANNSLLGEQLSQNVHNLASSITMLTSLIDQTASSITSSVSSTYATQTALNSAASELASQIRQTADLVEFSFTQSTEQTKIVGDALSVVRADLQTMIRLNSNGVEVGQLSNPVKTLIAPDGMHIIVNGVEVAFFTSNQSLIDRARILTSMQIGNFIVQPDASGGIWWRWLG